VYEFTKHVRIAALPAEPRGFGIFSLAANT
jgi:hypothetical protein